MPAPGGSYELFARSSSTSWRTACRDTPATCATCAYPCSPEAATSARRYRSSARRRAAIARRSSKSGLVIAVLPLVALQTQVEPLLVGAAADLVADPGGTTDNQDGHVEPRVDQRANRQHATEDDEDGDNRETVAGRVAHLDHLLDELDLVAELAQRLEEAYDLLAHELAGLFVRGRIGDDGGDFGLHLDHRRVDQARKAGRVVDRLALRLQRADDAARLKEAQVVLVGVDDAAPLPCLRQLPEAGGKRRPAPVTEDDRDPRPVCERELDRGLVAIGRREREIVVGRKLALQANRDLRVVVELNVGETLEDRPARAIRTTVVHEFPGDIARAVQTHTGLQTVPLRRADVRRDVVLERLHEAIAVGPEPLRLADPRLLDLRIDAAAAGRVEAGRDTARRRARAQICARKLVRRQVQDRGQVAVTLTLRRLRIADGQQSFLHDNLRLRGLDETHRTPVNPGCQGRSLKIVLRRPASHLRGLDRREEARRR